MKNTPKTRTSAERYNNRMQKIWEDSRRIEAERIAAGEIPNPNLTPQAEMMTTDERGDSVRGFRVWVKGNGRAATLPCSGVPLYTGEQALGVLESYAKNRPGVETRAFTYSKFSGQEVLDLEEMLALYGPEFACAD